jgi:PAS domain S-box-containing protein
MNLHFKLILPALLMLGIIVVTTHFYWLPNYFEIEAEEQIKNEHSFVSLLGTALVPDLINDDLAKTHATLDTVIESRKYWHAINLFDRDQQLVYPLFEKPLPDDAVHVLIDHEIIFNNDFIGRIQVWVDVDGSGAHRVAQINNLEKLIFFTLLIVAIVATFLQDRWIRVPLKKLAFFARDIASGKYDSSIEHHSSDEIGELVKAFDSMKQQIKEREEELIESQGRNKAVIDNVIDGIISIDVHGNVITFNPAAEEIFGYSRDEVVGNNVKMLMPEPYKREHDGYLYNYVATGKKKIIGIGREVEGQRKDGSTFPLELAVSEVQLSDRRLFIGITRDITERKKIEKMKSEFVSTVSHELRTPLTSIRGAISLVLGKGADNLSPKMLRMLETANRNSERLTFLINDILDLEKINAGELDFHMEAVDIALLAKRAIEENEGYAHSHNVGLEISVATDASSIVRADGQRLLQVFANLISNAVKFSPKNDVVRISVERNEDRIRVIVADNGPGIPEEFRARIFSRFAQADSSDTREKGGTGLGLTITQAIVEQQGGSIGFESEPGEGSTFFFELPAWDVSVENVHHDSDMPKVLVCEDDADVAYILVNLLEHEGLSGDIAATAQSARELLEANDYRLLILDLKLPDASGLDLVKELRAAEKTRKLPIIVVSGRALEGRRAFDGDALTVADWLQKPIDRERLAESVNNAIGVNERPRILHVEDDLDVVQVTQSLFEEDADFDYATTLSDAKNKLDSDVYDLVIIDMSLPDGSGLELLEKIKQDCPVVLFSGSEVSGLGEKVGAALTKSRTTNDELMQTVKRLLKSTK